MPRKGTGAGGRPPKPPGERRINVTITLDPREHQKLKTLAGERGLSVGKLIEVMLQKELVD